MKVMEFVSLINNNKNKMLKNEQLQQLISRALEVKPYISIKEKKNLIDDIINDCIIYEDGILKFDEIDKYVVFTMRTIVAYTNLELSGDMETDYDMLCEAKLLNTVVETFAGEYENVRSMLQMRCDYILNGNNIEAQFGKFLTRIMDNVDLLFDKIKSFDFNNLPVSEDDLNKLITFVNSQKK